MCLGVGTHFTGLMLGLKLIMTNVLRIPNSLTSNHWVWVVLGSTLAGLAWIPMGLSWQLAILWFVVMAWLLAPSRKAAFTLIFFYYLVTSRDGGEMIHRFAAMNYLITWGIVIAYAASIALLWMIAWQRQAFLRFIGLIVILIVTSIPPLGGLIYGSPLLAAGWIFPSMGLIGIALLIASWGCTYAFTVLTNSNAKLIALAAVTCLTIASTFANLSYQAPKSEPIYALNTKLTVFPNTVNELYERHLKLGKMALEALHKTDSPIVVMPEGIGGIWIPQIAWIWEDISQMYKRKNKTLIVGFTTKPDQYANTAKVFGFNPDKVEDVFAKAPAPLGGWRPWADIHEPARWASPGTITVNGRILTFIFCWEELVPWPWLSAANAHSKAGSKPTTLVVMANHWFAKDLDIGDSQARSTHAWSRLFGWPFQRVVNEP
jgi:apolipoprotein N-acyltransferase